MDPTKKDISTIRKKTGLKLKLKPRKKDVFRKDAETATSDVSKALPTITKKVVTVKLLNHCHDFAWQ